VLDPDRKKMSKSKGNVETPDNWITQFTADGVRYWSAKAKIGVDTTFDVGIMKNGARLVTKLFNAGKFVLSYEGEYSEVTNELDLAFIDELRKLVAKTTNHFENFDHASALSETESFFWNSFTDSYLELVKKRVSPESTSSTLEKNSAITTLRIGLDVLLRLFAPFLPYITEEIWAWSFAEEKGKISIHMTSYPSVSEFENIEQPQLSNSFDYAIRFMDEIKKLRANKSLAFSTPIDDVAISVNYNFNIVFDLIKFDLINYSKIQNYSIVIDNTIDIVAID
jgi:valyl-tRNA synthetase